VVPEIASRAHVENINPLLTLALTDAGIWFGDVDAVAVTVGPGLVGALLVGLAAAKAAAMALDVPFIGVNHLEGHIYANFLTGRSPLEEPYVAFLVSGGHTMLIHVPEPFVYDVLGQTLDDAAGEAFDKIARFMGLGFPGGPALDRLAVGGNRRAIAFPRALAGPGFDFSLSGLKTAVVRHVKAEQQAGREVVPEDLAASFQEAIVEVQVDKTIAAAREKGVRHILMGGGVVANRRLRELMTRRAAEAGLELWIPPPELCTDNAAMVASAGYYRVARGERTDLEVGADPGLPLTWAPSVPA
jgi:N6-L-threonylcarbamoyladenine synthase